MSVLVSVIIPLYNKECSIKHTIESVLSQSYTNFELLVINDGSTDKSVEKVKEIQDKRVVLIEQSNAGVSAARNEGIFKAKGEWILFLDADDLLLPEALKCLVTNINDTHTIIGGNFLIKTPQEQLEFFSIRKHKVYESEDDIYKAWALNKLFLRTGSFIMPTILAKLEPYNNQYSRYEDLDFLFRCFKHCKIKLIPDVLMIYETSYAEASKVNQKRWNRDYLCFLPSVSENLWKNIVYGKCVNEVLRTYPSRIEYLKNSYKDYHLYCTYAKMIAYYSLLMNCSFNRVKRKLKRMIKS